MRFVFRADASKSKGAGHVARLLAVAEEVSSRGFECIFIGDIGDSDWILDKFRTIGVTHLPSEKSEFFQFLESDILFFDSYNFSMNDPFICSKNWSNRILLADNSTPDYEADLVFFVEEIMNGNKYTDSLLFQGLKYFPLRKSVFSSNIFCDNLNKIVVVGGGTDPYNFAEAMYKILSRVEGHWKATIFSDEFRLNNHLDNRFEVLKFGRSLDFEIDSSNLVFATASTVALETLARGIPLGLACAVENQKMFYKYLTSNNLAAPIGFRDRRGSWNLDPISVDRMIQDQKLRYVLVENSKKFIDCFGSKRIVDKVFENL